MIPAASLPPPDLAPATIGRPTWLDHLNAPGFRVGGRRDLLARVAARLPADRDEWTADRLDRAAAIDPDTSPAIVLHLIPIHEALNAMAGLYRLRAARPAVDSHAARQLFQYLRRVAARRLRTALPPSCLPLLEDVP